MDIHAKTALLAIVASHLVADFWLQGDGDVLAKRRFQFFAYLKHGATHALALMSSPDCGPCGRYQPWYLSAILPLTV